MRLLASAVLVAFAAGLIAASGALGAVLHVKLIARTGESGGPPEGVVRTADGTLHIVYSTRLSWSNAADGVAATSISQTGKPGPQVQALSGWSTGLPGLAVLGSGELEAVFGGSPDNGSAGNNSGPWAITSADGGASWSGPADVGSHSLEALAGDVTAQVLGGTPFLTVPQAGGLVMQQGLGGGSASYQVTTSGDGFLGNVDSAVDASSGQEVASWYSSDSSPGLWFQQVAPTVGAAQKVPGPLDTGQRQQLVLAPRDNGPGVFAAYAPDAHSTQIRLLRYGGGSIAVGAIKGLSAQDLGVATGLEGRIWAMWWGQVAGRGVIAITRSNRAVTRFEPIQRFNLDSSYMWRIFGDGRLGPLDLLVNEVPAPAPGTPAGSGLVNGIYTARVFPELSAKISAKSLPKGKFKLSFKVSDAGEPVSGATVSAKGMHAKTNKQGAASIVLTGSAGQKVAVAVTAPGYKKLSASRKL